MYTLPKDKIIKLHTLLTKLGITEAEKRFMIIETTQGRTKSSKELSAKEYEILVYDLQQTLNLQQGEEAEVLDKLRKRVISLYREMGSNVFDETKQRMVADMKSINTSLQEHWNNNLNGFDKKQLTKIIAVLNNTWKPAYYKKMNDGKD